MGDNPTEEGHTMSQQPVSHHGWPEAKSIIGILNGGNLADIRHLVAQSEEAYGNPVVASNPVESWHSVAILADFLERLGKHQPTLDWLLRALKLKGHPNEKNVERIRELCREALDEKASSDVGLKRPEAINVLRLVLRGLLFRYMAAGRDIHHPDSHALGLTREQVRESLDEWEKNIESPLTTADPSTRLWDLSRTHLKQSKFSAQEDDALTPKQGVTAWDVQLRRPINSDHGFLVASWIRGGIDLFKFSSGSEAGSPSLTRLSDPPAQTPEKADLDVVPYSRVAHIVRVGTEERERSYVMLFPTPDDDATDLSCQFIEVTGSMRDEDHVRLPADVIKNAPTRPIMRQDREPSGLNESVYSLLELEEGLILLGLRGIRGQPRLHLLNYRSSSDPLGIELRSTRVKEISAVYPLGKHGVSRNPVWALDRIRASENDDLPVGQVQSREHLVFVGCEDGRVLAVTLPRLANVSWDEMVDPTEERVGTVGRPVWALRCRDFQETAGKRIRVYAGASDGTVVAWQGRFKKKKSEDKIHRPYKPLWAANVHGAVSGVHLLNPGRPRECNHAVLVVTQDGRIAAFQDDSDSKVHHKGAEHHHRLTVPGMLLGSQTLGTKSFASVFDEGRPPSCELGSLIVCTGDRRVGVVSLNHSILRSGRKGDLDTGLTEVDQMFGGRSDLHTLICVLRAGSAYALDRPMISRLLVRWLLFGIGRRYKIAGQEARTVRIQALTKIPYEDREGTRQWLPRYLRPLIDMRLAWLAVLKGGAETGAQIDFAAKSLRLALIRIHRLGDHELFNEVLQIVLSRLNHLLFRRSTADKLTSRGESSLIHLMSLAEKMIDVAAQSTSLWAGTSVETSVVINLVENVLDGDTFWAVSLAEQELRSRSPSHEHGIVRRRVRLLQEVLARRDERAATDVVHAVNESLMRAALRLRANGWNKEIPWQALDQYFAVLGEIASLSSSRVTFGSDARLNHEVNRSYTLGMLLCSSHAVAIANRAVESTVGDLDPILHDLDVLRDIGFDIGDDKYEAVRIALTADFAGAIANVSRSGEPERRTEDQLANDSLLHSLGAIGVIVTSLRQLAHDLRQDLREVRIGELLAKLAEDAAATWPRDIERIKKSGISEGERQIYSPQLGREGDFRYSKAFWTQFLDNLAHSSLFNGKIPTENEPIRPDFIVASRVLAQLCDEALRDLDHRTEHHQIFRPHSDEYRKVLIELREAAADCPRSAEVQRNIVSGVLGHGLLEKLDEHGLQLIEIAQDMDPHLVWEWMESGHPLVPPHRSLAPTETEPRPSRRSTFATYLLGRATRAESAPKALRSLQAVLEDPASAEKAHISVGLDQMMRSHLDNSGFATKTIDRIMSVSAEAPGLTRDEQRRLELVFSELMNNYVTHGWGTESHEGMRIEISPTAQSVSQAMEERKQGAGKADEPITSFEPTRALQSARIEGDKLCGCRLSFKFSLSESGKEDFLARIELLEKEGLMQPIEPWDDPQRVSYGTGLYLANLAAATVDWALTAWLGDWSEPTDEEPSEGWLEFALFKTEKVTEAYQ